jgi:hypothetical protein
MPDFLPRTTRPAVPDPPNKVKEILDEFRLSARMRRGKKGPSSGITAKHVVAGLKDDDRIDIYQNNGWTSLAVKILRCEDPIDIAILVPPFQLTVNFELSFDRTNFFWGQDAFFLGFPYGLQSPGAGVNGQYPLPLIKRGTISATLPVDSSKKAVLVLLDGYNNPGFSGGPIVYRDLNQNALVLKLIGVISGFIPEVVPAMEQHVIESPASAGEIAKGQPWRIRRKPDGSYFELVDNGTFVPLNTGIVQVYVIDPAIDLIRKHPMGPVTKNLTAVPVGKKDGLM